MSGHMIMILVNHLKSDYRGWSVVEPKSRNVRE